MKVGDKFRIMNCAGCLDVEVREILDTREVQIRGVVFPNESKVRIECHESEYGDTLITVYSGANDSRDIYLVEPSHKDVTYYLGFIEKFERENIPLYKTV